MDSAWAEYLNAIRRLEQAVRLTCFWALETARATREAAYYTQVTADKVKEAMKLRRTRIKKQRLPYV